MATRPDEADDFRSAVLRARQAAAAVGELAALERKVEPLALDETERKTWQRVIEDGTFDRAVAAVVASDPEIANC